MENPTGTTQPTPDEERDAVLAERLDWEAEQEADATSLDLTKDELAEALDEIEAEEEDELDDELDEAPDEDEAFVQETDEGIVTGPAARFDNTAREKAQIEAQQRRLTLRQAGLSSAEVNEIEAFER
jgi:hypothetical protein